MRNQTKCGTKVFPISTTSLISTVSGLIWMSLGVSRLVKWIPQTLVQLPLCKVPSRTQDVPDTLNKTMFSQRIINGTRHLIKARTAHGSYLFCLTLKIIKAMTIILFL